MRPPLHTLRTGAPRIAAALLVAAVLASCGGNDGQVEPAGEDTLSAEADLGRQMFFDTGLSATGQLSCASCHSPDRAFADGQGRAVSLGGRAGDLPGLRNAPALTYLSFTPAFQAQEDAPPVGGFFHDGRSPSLAHQAQQPFLQSFEMANADAGEVLGRLRTRPYLAKFEAVFGPTGPMPAATALQRIGDAIAAFQLEAPAFRRFDSKYDHWLQGQATLSTAERNGLQLFNNPAKGNCAACHTSSAGANGRAPLFTNFTYDNIGVPRNWALPSNAAGSALPYVPANGSALGAPAYRYYDLGVCGPLNSEVLADATCGKFKVPSLRNVGLTGPYFHNGVFNTLTDVVTWYVTRDITPARWYRKADGVTPDGAYNDLPTRYRDNINVVMAPYGPRTTPALSAAEISDVVKFLCTLTDGYDPSRPAAYPVPDECR